jgi:hypothetical protein
MQTINLKRTGLYALVGLCLALVINACTPPQQTESQVKAEAIASGPFFSGPNSLIAEQEVDFDKLIDGQSLTAKQLKSVKLQAVSVSLRAIDSIDFSYFDDASLSIVGSEIEMMSIATLNPLEGEGQSISLGVSEEAELVDYFKAGSYSLVLDLGLNEDLYLNELGATIDISLNVEYKEQ